MWDRVQRWWHGRGLWRRVDKHGWTAVYVGTYESAPTWVYSIGFDETLNQPEVVVFDVPQQTANALLWEVFEALKAGALVLEDGKDWTQEGMEGRLDQRESPPGLARAHAGLRAPTRMVASDSVRSRPSEPT